MRRCEIVDQGVATLIRALLSEYKRYSRNKTSSRERQAVPRTKVRRAAEGLLAIGFSLSAGSGATLFADHAQRDGACPVRAH